MTTHVLKTWPAYFQAIADGAKTFEIRRNDRDYQTGDLLRLVEWDPDTGAATGRELARTVGFVAAGQIFDLALDGHVVMSLLPAAVRCEHCDVLVDATGKCVCVEPCGTAWCWWAENRAKAVQQ